MSEEVISGEGLFQQYWSNVSGGLSSTLEKISSNYAGEDYANAVKRMEIADALATQYEHFSTRAAELAKSADQAGLDMRKSAQDALDSASLMFKTQAEALRSQGLDALNKVDADILSGLNRELLSKTGGMLGPLADALNVGLKAVDGDYYGAAGAFIGAVAGAALAAALVGLTGWISIPLAVGFGILTESSFDSILNYFDPLGINSDVNADFSSALNFIQRRDPLTLDLDGDGIETVSANSSITFDFDGDGLKTGTGWVKGDDGFLVLDRNGNGTIDTGRELFGVDTVKSNGQKASDGFDALRDLDGNADGVFDAQDAQFANVRVWQDVNQDGVAQASELKTLAEHDITAINLGSTQTSQNSNGNLISATGSFVRGDGSSGTVTGNQSLAANLDLASNPFYREYTDRIELDETVKALPDMQGSGAVRDLREAAMQNGELKSLLGEYAQLQTRQEQMGMLDKLIEEWAQSSNYRTFDQRVNDMDSDSFDFTFYYSWEVPEGIALSGGSTGGSSSSGEGIALDDTPEGPTAAQLEKQALLEKIKLLEVFNAQNFFNFAATEKTASTGEKDISFSFAAGSMGGGGGSLRGIPVGARSIYITEEMITINSTQASFLNQAYEALKQSVYNGLLLQTRLKPYVEAINLNLTADGVELDYSGVEQKFIEVASQDTSKALLDLVDLKRAPSLGLSTEFLSPLLAEWVEALTPDESNSIRAQLGQSSTVLIGDAAADQLKGSSLDEQLYGGAGDDNLDGGAGSNQLYGGSGNDTLKVASGSTNNVLAGGEGNDTLYGSYYSDTYVFNLGDGQDTIIETSAYTGAVDVLRFGEGIRPEDLQYQKVGTDLRVVHANGLDQVVIKGVFNSTSSAARADSSVLIERLEFADGTVQTWAEVIQAGVVSLGSDAADTLNGWAGNDILYGGVGDDVLDGGAGSNRLYGGSGNDILKVASGSTNNVLAGGEGSDTLYGSYYSDTYLFNLGDGQDTIVETSTYSGAVDVLRFGTDLSPEQLWFQRNGNNLDILVEGSSDRVTVNDWYASSSSRIEQMQTADGKTLLDSQVQNLVDAMASFGVPAGGESNLTSDQRAQLEVVIAANW